MHGNRWSLWSAVREILTVREYRVYYQRYPEHPAAIRIFSNEAEAISFLENKQNDYSYTVGKVWMKVYEWKGAV
jgi:hypothetical protein